MIQINVLLYSAPSSLLPLPLQVSLKRSKYDTDYTKLEDHFKSNGFTTFKKHVQIQILTDEELIHYDFD